MRSFVAALAIALSACGPATPPPAQQSSATSAWDANLNEMLPFIDACLAKSPNTRWITYAGRTGEALVTVRLEGDGQSVDCTVPDDNPSSDHAVIAPRREDVTLDGERAAIFVRGPGANPGGECYEAPEVRSTNGELLGWMADPAGC